MKTPLILQTKDLSIGYNNSAIINQINLEINLGELISVIGINGSGKSTLLKTITQVEPKIGGEILLNNQPIESYSLNSRAQEMGLVYAKQNIDKSLSIAEVIALGRHPYTNWIGKLTHYDKTQIIKAAELVGLKKNLQTKCNTLSDGQLQKVMVARVLAQQTKLIVLDEPTSHLDMYHKIYIFRLLKDICKEQQKAILFATHEINLALQLCSKIIVIHQEQIYYDTPKSLADSGILNQLFPSNLINFDSNQLIFKI